MTFIWIFQLPIAFNTEASLHEFAIIHQKGANFHFKNTRSTEFAMTFSLQNAFQALTLLESLNLEEGYVLEGNTLIENLRFSNGNGNIK